MSSLIEDYGLIGDLQSAALVSRHGCIDWLCLPASTRERSSRHCSDGGERHWTLQPEGEFRSPGRRYRGDTLVLETELETATGAVRLIDFMPPRETKPDVVRIVEGIRGRVEMRMELVLRFDYGSIVPWVPFSRAPWSRSPAPMRSRSARQSSSRAATCTRTARSRSRGRPSPVRPDLVPLQPLPRQSTPRGRSRTRCPSGTSGRPPVASRGGGTTRSTAPAHAQGDDLRADRRHRGGADHLATGSDRRRAELGLPLLLAPRRDADPAGAPAG